MTALTIAAIGMAGLPAATAAASVAGPALASSSEGEICLTNANSNCVSIQPGSAFNAVLGSQIIDRNIVGTDQAGHWEAEIESTAVPGECLADTGLSAGAPANWQACGANGTVWILVPHSDGAYMESRFAVNRGTLLVLTANSPTPGTQLYVGNPTNPGSAFWQTFSFYPG
jgi:hypothetical protein